MKTFLAICILTWLCRSAGGETFYVNVAGSDSNTGKENSPQGAFRTIAKALASALAGDTLKISRGEYPETPSTKRHGTAVAPIVIEGEGDATIIGGFLVLHDFIHLKNFKSATLGTNTGNITFGTRALHLNKATGLVGNHGLVENVTFTRQNGSQTSVEGNPPFYTGPVGTNYRKCRFLDAGAGVALILGGVGSIVEECYFSSQNGADAVFLFGRNNIIRKNKFINWSRPTDSKQHTDIFQAFSSNGEISLGHLIDANLIKDCAGCQLGIIEDQSRRGQIGEWEFRNNLIVRVGAPFILCGRDIKIINNTFVSSATEQGYAILLRASSTRGTATGCKIFNNIFYKGGFDSARPSLGFYGFVELADHPLTGFEADHNLVIGTGAGTVKGSLWTYLNANSNSLNGVDPAFVNPAKDDYRLEPHSPARDKGKVLRAEFSSDYAGRSRGQSWDLGANEYYSDEIKTIGKPQRYQLAPKAGTN